MVFTVVVTPGTGACVTLTDPPWLERPESGNWLAVAPWEELAAVADPICACMLRASPIGRNNTAKALRRKNHFLGILIDSTEPFSQLSCFRKRQTLRATRANVKRNNARKLGQSVPIPLPFIMLARTTVAKW